MTSGWAHGTCGPFVATFNPRQPFLTFFSLLSTAEACTALAAAVFAENFKILLTDEEA